jgi:ketosteroid isomerase-like protein
MVQRNVDVIRRGLEAFNRRDRDAWIEVCDPNVENIPPEEWPENAPIRGPEAIWEFFVDAVTAWEEGSYEWGELVEVGPNRVVANQRREMRGQASGAETEWSYWVAFTFKSGRVLRFEWFADRDEAFGAAGLEQ